MSSPLTGLAGRYALALFELAEEQGRIDVVARDLEALASMVDDNADLHRLVTSPAFGRDDQVNAITAIMEAAKAEPLTVSFVGAVAANGRLFIITDIIRTFLAELAERRGEISAEVVTAVELDKKRQTEVETAVARFAASDKVSLSMRVDPALIGGMVVRIGSRMIDTSIRTKLNRLETAMKGVG